MNLAIETVGLGKRYGTPRGRSRTVRFKSLRDGCRPSSDRTGRARRHCCCLLVGLSRPTSGRPEVLGVAPGPTEEFLARIGYLAQEVPLYKRLSADDHLAIGAHLNGNWDASGARERLAALGVPTDRPIATLSGGQRAQVALGLALAKRPQVLLLDEPVAALDPLARREFLASLSEAVAEGDLSVVLSSHLLHDLERVCDHVILLASSRTQICDDIDTVLASHKMLLGPRRTVSHAERAFDVIKDDHTANQTRLLVRLDGPVLDPAWEVSEVSLEEIVLAYMGMDEPASFGPLTSVRTAS